MACRAAPRDRWFRLDDEVRLEVFEVGFAAQMTSVFERDRRDATGFTCAIRQARSVRERIADAILLPIRSQLGERPPAL